MARIRPRRGTVGGRLGTAFLLVLFVTSVLPPSSFVTEVAADPPFPASSQVNDDGLGPIPPSRTEPSVVARGGEVFVANVIEGSFRFRDLFLSRSTDGGATWESPEPQIDGAPASADQFTPTLTLLPNGTLAAAWVDSRDGANDIYFSRSSDGGTTWSRPDVRVNSGPGARWRFAPAITTDSSGVLYVAWEDYRDGDSDIYYARSLDGGLTWTDPNVRVNDGGHPGGFYPTIAVMSGTVVVVWAGRAPSRSDLDLYAARSLDGGGTWSATQSVNTASGGNVFRPSLAAGPGGDLLLSWSDERNGFLQIYASRSLDAGATWTDPGVRVSATTRVQDEPSSVIMSGGLGVAWVDNRGSRLDVYFARSADGSSWSETLIGGGGFPYRARPRLAAGGSTLYAVWQESLTGFPERWEVRLNRSDDQGITWGPEIRIPEPPLIAADQTDPSIVVGADGTIYAAWMDHRNSGEIVNNVDGDIYFARSTDGGQTWSRPTVRVSEANVGASESAPQLALASDGTLHLVWEDRQRRLMAARSSDGGATWTPAVPVSPGPTPEEQIYPAFLANATDTLFVVFQGYEAPDWRPYVARSSDGGASWTTVPLPSFWGLDAAVAADLRGNLYAGWLDGSSMYFTISRSTDGGSTWSSPVWVAPGGGYLQGGGRLAADAGGTVYAVWSEAVGGSPNDIFFSRSTDYAATWSPPLRLNQDPGATWQTQPDMAVGFSGSVYVAWTDRRNGDDDIYLTNSTDGGLTWSIGERRVNDDAVGSGVHQLDPAIAVARGAIYAAWRDDRTADWDIRFAATGIPPNSRPNASFTVNPPSGTVQTDFVVDASASTDAEDPPSALQVRWDWEDDGAWDTAWSVQKTAQHTYATLGTFTIRAEVRDTGGLTNSTMQSVTVANTPPTASFAVSPPSGDTQTTFEVDASASADLEDPQGALEVRWDWEDDGVWDTAWTTVKTASHRYGQPGTHTIRMEVRDGYGSTNTTSSDVVVTPGSGSPAGWNLAGLAPYALVALAVVGVVAAGLYVFKRRKRTEGHPPEML